MTLGTFKTSWPGGWYFRILGFGLWWATYASDRPLFSERNGYSKPLLRFKKSRAFLLTPWK